MMSLTFTILSLMAMKSWTAAILLLPVLMVMSSLKLFSPMSIPHSMSPLISIDSMSTLLIMLTLWITTLMLTSSMKLNVMEIKKDMFLRTTLTLCLILIMAFSVNNLFAYYIFFEASLIPTLILILVWGYQPERLEAGVYLMLYTMTASLPLLIGILYKFNSGISLHFAFQSISTNNMFLTTSLLLAFLVKMPMYFTHLWLPKAHVEAPLAGSMILASVLLKLGAYGILRTLHMFPTMIVSPLTPIIISISLWGAVLTSILCIRQLDMKSMIAYSSVSHMAILIAGIFSSSKWGWEGAMMMMIAHGLTSSGLFALANMYYENTHSRSLMINKGILFLFPSMALWWFLMLSANMAAPPTINLLAEFMLIQGMLSYSLSMAPILLITPFFTVAYSMILYTSLHHGQPSSFIHYMNMPPTYFTTSLLHVAPSFMLITSASQISLT